MSLAAVLLAVVALLVGCALGWTAHAARGGSELAAARAEAATLRSSHQMAAASLAAASEDAARRQSAAIGSAVGHLVAAEEMYGRLGLVAERSVTLRHLRAPDRGRGPLYRRTAAASISAPPAPRRGKRAITIEICSG